MSVAWVGAAVAAVGAVGGAYISAKSNEKVAKRAAQAADFLPFNVNTGSVSSTVSDDGETITGRLNEPLTDAQNNLNIGVQGGTAAAPGIGQGDRAFQQDRFDTGTNAAGRATQNLISDTFGQNRQLSRQQALVSGGLGNFLGNSQQALGQIQQSSGFANQRGQDLLGQNTGQVREQELALLRAQARPDEDRAVNAKFQSLFGRGQLGSTGGANQIEALARAQENADIGRQLAAQQTAQSQQGLNFSTGQGLLGLGQQGANLGASINANQLSGLQEGVGTIGNLGQQRLANSQSLFGFGQDLRGLGLDEAREQLGLSGALEEINRGALNLSATFGGAQATAGGNVANALLTQQGNTTGNVIGGALSSFGNSLLQSQLPKIT